MPAHRVLPPFSPAIPLICMLAGLTGCVSPSIQGDPLTVQTELGDVTDVLAEGETGDAAEDLKSTAVKVEVRSARGKTKMAEVAYREKALVSDVLKETGAGKAFRRVTIKLRRAGVPGIMKVEYDNSKDRVESLYDYAVRPGDHLIVEEDTSSIFDDMLKTFTAGRM